MKLSPCKFIELAETRVPKVLKQINIVGNLSDKEKYEYTDKQVKQIYDALKESLDRMKARFENGEQAPKAPFRGFFLALVMLFSSHPITIRVFRMNIDELEYLNDLIDSGGEITIGSIGAVDGVTAVDESNCLAMLGRNSGETLSELLIRLDEAIRKAVEEDIYTVAIKHNTRNKTIYTGRVAGNCAQQAKNSCS